VDTPADTAFDPEVAALALLDALADGDDGLAEDLLAEVGEEPGDSDPDPPTPDTLAGGTGSDDAPDTALKSLSLPPRVLAAVRLHRRASDGERAELVRLAAEDPEGYERLVDDEVVGMAEDELFAKSAAHAPAGGVTVQGKEYKGGEFIPAEVMERATDEEKAAVGGNVPGGESGGPPQTPDWLDRRKPRFAGPTHYHGTPEQIAGFDGRPTSFTTNEHHAKNFGENLHAVKLDVRKPLDLTALGSGAADGDGAVSGRQIAEALAEHGIVVDIDPDRRGWTTNILRPHLPEIFRQGRALGFDGLRVADFKDFEADEVMPFSPRQVKVVAVNGVKPGAKQKTGRDFAAAFREAIAGGFDRRLDVGALRLADDDPLADLVDAAKKGRYGPAAAELAADALGWGYTANMVHKVLGGLDRLGSEG
jgi:hypothetical protein